MNYDYIIRLMLNSNPQSINSDFHSRRQFLTLAACIPSLALFPSTSVSADFWSLPRELWLCRNTPSGWEQTRSTYWADGELIIDGYRNVCTLLRDVKANNAVQMDVVLLDILRGVQGWLQVSGINKPIIINSGHRTQSTNANTEGSARNSLHLYGKAADIWVEGISTEYLARLGVYLSGGGVGFYARKGFVHVDSGRLRSWRG